MKSSLSVALLAATFLVAAPVAHVLSPLASLDGTQAFAAGNGHGGGNGNAGGNGNGGSRGNSGDHSHGKPDGNGMGNAGPSSRSSASDKKGASSQSKVIPPKKQASVTTKTKPATAATPEKKNIHAQLKGLNSLKRNINGMMNSADPRMAAIRAYITAAGTLQATTTAYQKAQDTTKSAQATLDSLTAQKTELQAKIDANPTDTSLTAQMTELDTKIADATKALADAQTAEANAKTAYDAAVAAAGPVVTDENLTAAITAAESPNTTLSADAMTWAKDQVNRLVGDYAAKI